MTKEDWAELTAQHVAMYNKYVKATTTAQAPAQAAAGIPQKPAPKPPVPPKPESPKAEPSKPQPEKPLPPSLARVPAPEPQVPNSMEAERGLLGSLMMENRHIIEAAQQLVPEDFFLSAHQHIYRAAAALLERGQPADLITVSDELKRAGQLEAVGGVTYLVTLGEGLVMRDSVAPYIRILRRKSGLRCLLRSAEELTHCAMLPDATLEDCKARWTALFDDRRLQLTNRLRACAAGELLRLDLPPRGMVLGPVIPTQGLTMLYSPRGVGKTYLALGIAWAVATGSEFLRWRAPQPRKVLFVDGELPATTLQERLAAIQKGALDQNRSAASRSLGGNEASEQHNLRLITPDLQEFGVPDISTRGGQALIENELEGAELLVLDNLSALVRSGNENEGESWMPIADWGLRLRQRGVSVLFLHHAGKSGAQRGTSRREDLLDTVIALKRPPDYCPSQGLRCEVRYEKARGFHGDEAKPFEVRMDYGDDGAISWLANEPASAANDPLAEAAGTLFEQGKSVREVARELGISPSSAHRRLQWLKQQGGESPAEAAPQAPLV